jgi:Pex2 / Pex12 amino terminal region
MLVVERHYLLTYGGSFTENFYGLKRERVLRVRSGEVPRAQLGAPALVRETLKLGSGDVWRNLAVLVGVPYLKRKLDESYDIHIPQTTLLGPAYQNRNASRLPPNATMRQRVIHWYKWFLRHVYPSVNAAYYFALLAFNLAYLFDGSKYHSPFLWMIGTRMRRLGEADHRAIALAAQSSAAAGAEPAPAPPPQTTTIFNPRAFVMAIFPRLLSSLKILLPTSIFALKFLEWWHASDFARQLSKKATENLDLPPPTISGLPPTPPPASKAASSSPAKQSNLATTKPSPPIKPPISSTTLLQVLTVPPAPSSSLCPICLSRLQTPTAAQTGYVYCYTCIHKWVSGEHERQTAFMEGGGGEEGWGEDEGGGSRKGRWECGVGRCAVTGRRVLGGVEGLRRVVA